MLHIYIKHSYFSRLITRSFTNENQKKCYSLMKLIESSRISSFKNSTTIENFSIKFPKPQSLSASNKDKSAKINTHPPRVCLDSREKEAKKKKKKQEK